MNKTAEMALVAELQCEPAENLKVLYTLLASIQQLALNAKVAHWNVKGSTFKDLHAMFEDVYKTASDAADDIAERARQLEGEPLISPDTMRELSLIPAAKIRGGPFNTSYSVAILSNLSNRRVWKEATKAFLGDDDNVTADMLIKQQAEMEKTAWFLRSTLGLN